MNKVESQKEFEFFEDWMNDLKKRQPRWNLDEWNVAEYERCWNAAKEIIMGYETKLLIGNSSNLTYDEYEKDELTITDGEAWPTIT